MDKWQELRNYLLAEQKRTAEEERTYMAHPAVSSSMLMQKRTIEKHLAFMADLERKEKRERKMKSHDKTIQSKKVLELVKNDIVSIDEALTLTDEETVFLHTCSNPTEVVLIPDYAYGENEIELETGELLFCYRKGEISLDTHYVYNARDFYNERFFKFVPKAPLEEKKQKIQRFKEKYESEFKKYISELNLSGISNFLDDYNYQKANTSLIFGDKEFTALVIFRLVTSEDYEMWDTIIWDEENFEFVKKENPKPMPKTKAGKKNRITY